MHQCDSPGYIARLFHTSRSAKKNSLLI